MWSFLHRSQVIRMNHDGKARNGSSRASIWTAITDMAASVDRDQCKSLFGGHLHCGLDGVGARERLPVGAEDHEAHLAITHAASQVGHLAHAEC